MDYSSSSSSLSCSLLTSSSSSTSSDEEIFEIISFVQKRCLRDRSNPFDICSDGEFHMRYRLTKPTVMKILHTIGSNLEPSTQRNKPISAINQLLTTLRFLATGAFQIVVGDEVKIHKSTVCRIVKRVVPTIAALSKTYIYMPKDEREIEDVKAEFKAVDGFPSVVGCLDATHIRMQSPGGTGAELYRNSKNYYSYNVQLICDAQLRIRNIDARWPGSTVDSKMFESSEIRARFERGEFPNCFLLGDHGYPCEDYLLIPVLDPTMDSERRYNEAHANTRKTVEQAVVMWKQRFPSLAFGMRTTLPTSRSAIVAAAVLHNVAVEEGDSLPDMDEDLKQTPGEAVETEIFERYQENAVRAEIIRTVFA